MFRARFFRFLATAEILRVLLQFPFVMREIFIVFAVSPLRWCCFVIEFFIGRAPLNFGQWGNIVIFRMRINQWELFLPDADVVAPDSILRMFEVMSGVTHVRGMWLLVTRLNE